MKPYMLVLLMAIPAMIGHVLSAESADPVEPAAKPCASAATCPSSTTSTTTTIPAKTTAPAPAAKPAPSSTNTPAQPKPWFM